VSLKTAAPIDKASQICEASSCRMPLTKVILFTTEDGSVPFLDWFGAIPPKAQDKCRVRLERLQQLGHELRRPEADFLRDGIYELRVALRGVNYRMLYFFHGREVVVVSHGIVKERIVPPREIELALQRKAQFGTNPRRHTYAEPV
jgi:phage-related protein